jgi:hypothetical protein
MIVYDFSFDTVAPMYLFDLFVQPLRMKSYLGRAWRSRLTGNTMGLLFDIDGLCSPAGREARELGGAEALILVSPLLA